MRTVLSSTVCEDAVPFVRTCAGVRCVLVVECLNSGNSLLIEVNPECYSE